MRTFPGIRLAAFRNPAERAEAQKIDIMLRQVTGGLARSLLPGQAPAANPVSSSPQPGGSSVPTPVVGDLLFGANTAVGVACSRLGIGAAGSILNVSAGLPAWGTALSLLPVHDHSTAAQGGNIPETSITDGTLLARLAANEVVTGSWDFVTAVFTKMLGFGTSGYDGTGLLLSDGASNVQVSVAALQSDNGQVVFPNCSGTSIILIGASETLVVTNKILGGGTKLRTNAAGGSCVFQDSASTTKQFAVDLAGCTAGTLSVLDINATTAKTWTLQDVTGTIYQTDGSDVVVADGGTGVSSLTSNAVLLGGATVGSVGPGAASTVLRGTGAAPTFGGIDHNYLVSRTRSIWIPADDFISGTGTPTYGNTGTWPDLYPNWLLVATG